MATVFHSRGGIELWTVTVSLSFPQVTNEYAAPAEEEKTGEDRSEQPPAVTLGPP
jgi:hypothetical protein